MSQTETLLLVVLGFSLAALIFLFVGRLIWTLALRLGARRMQRQVPSTMAELHGERDRLRAEYAKLSQKMGARFDSLKMQMAEQMAEVTRSRNRIAALIGDLNDREAGIVGHEQDIASLRTRSAELESNLAEAHATIADLRAELSQKTEETVSLRRALEERDQQLAGLVRAPEAEILPPEAPANDHGTAQERLQRRIDRMTAMSQQMAEARSAAAEPDPVLQEKLEQAARETEDLQKELARLDAAWNSKLADTDESSGPAPAPQPVQQAGAVANVISLANRIRSLQKDIAG